MKLAHTLLGEISYSKKFEFCSTERGLAGAYYQSDIRRQDFIKVNSAVERAVPIKTKLKLNNLFCVQFSKKKYPGEKHIFLSEHNLEENFNPTQRGILNPDGSSFSLDRAACIDHS